MPGTDTIAIRDATTARDIETIKSLFLEYAESLDFNLCFQGFDAELATQPGRYSAQRHGIRRDTALLYDNPDPGATFYALDLKG